MSGFTVNLNGEAFERYKEKISCIGSVDPYSLKNGSEDFRIFPSVTNMDIVQYLVYEKSAYTKTEFKAFKSLDSYKNYRAGYVKTLNCHRIDEYCVVKSRVTHSQRLNTPNTHTWVLCKSSGEVISAHCNCVAGLGEVCSHVGATLFAVEDKVRSHTEGQSVTDTEAYWKLPSGSLGTMASVANIVYSQDWAGCTTPQDESDEIKEPSKEEQLKWLHDLQDDGDNPGLMNVVEPFCRTTSLGLSKLLFNDANKLKSLEELITIGQNISFVAQDIEAIEKLTRGQHKNPKWHEIREGRITASLFKTVCRTSLNNPSMSLIKRVCYPKSVSFKSKATSYGCKHESDALREYTLLMQGTHSNFIIYQTGLILNNNYPYLGASPDSFIECDCCGKGVLEIKCPFCARDGELFEEILALKTSFLTTTGTGVHPYSLSISHAYYYQIQMQMALSNVTFGDFFVWNKNQYFYERINYSNDFWQENVEKANIYHKKIIMPELLGKYFTKES